MQGERREGFQTAGETSFVGLNLPHATDTLARQLKGEDDIRQDAVMEQAFVLINSLLTRDIKTRRRNLVIRTYRVVPLQNTTGLIEFVPNTKALGDTLIPLYHKSVLFLLGFIVWSP